MKNRTNPAAQQAQGGGPPRGPRIEGLDPPPPGGRGLPVEGDLPRGPDRLGIRTEVEALTETICLKDMDPPLVVGVLGGWGTGKSFVMHLMKERMRALRLRDLSDEAVRGKFPWVGHPYVIHFDAWTYAKADLWASLMQAILEGLEAQLSLEEKLGDDLVLAGKVDIWRLIEDFSPAQAKSFESELGKEVFESFKQWSQGENTSEKLLDALKKQKAFEKEALEKARDDLDAIREEYEEKLRENVHPMETEIGDAVESHEKEIAKLEAAHRVNLEKEEERRKLEKTRAEEALQRKLDLEARWAAMEPTWTVVSKLVGPRLEQTWKEANREHDEPPSVGEVKRSIGLVKLGLEGMDRSFWVLLLFGVFLLAMTFLLPQLEATQAWLEGREWFTGLTGLLGTVGSGLLALKQGNDWFEKHFEGFYRRRREILERQRIAGKEKLEEALSSIEEEHLGQVEDLWVHYQGARKKSIDEHIVELEKKEKEREKAKGKIDREMTPKIAAIESRVAHHEERVAMVIDGPSFTSVVREKLESGQYASRLGQLHRIQQDLEDLSRALMPVGGHDEELFPRGEPRIVLFVDDLDRCPPEQVVAMLEAAQLLVRSRLFVVVLAMDVRYVTRALEKQYEDILVRNGEPSGLDYIEKIVQIPYRVPPVSPVSLQDYLASQMTPPESRRDGEEEEVEPEPLPERVLEFTDPERDLLATCCASVGVSPRSARRLVNIFKLLKFIWYRRDLGDGPADDAKRAILLLLALSAKYPVLMRHVLERMEKHFGPEVTTDGSMADVVKQCLGVIPEARTMKGFEELESHDVRSLLAVEASEVGYVNSRLVKSFSFVGDVTRGPVPT